MSHPQPGASRSVVVANAGSGKTYLLANRIVRWMLEEHRRTGNASPDGILAVTFTRKAASEIVERILRHLALGAVDDRERAKFDDPAQVGRFGADEYQAVLEQFVQSLHRVSLSTIDGFFAQLARAFGPELGLPESWRIGEPEELDAQRLDAIGDVIAEDESRATELARRIADGQPKVEVQAGIDKALEDALGLWSRSALAGDPVRPWMRLADPAMTLFPGAKFASDAELRAALKKLREAAVPTTKDGQPRKVWLNARKRVADAIADRRWLDLLKDSLVQAVRAGELFDSSVATAAVSAPLDVAVGHALAELQAMLRARLAATAEMAALVDARLRSAQRADGVLGFGDIADALARSHVMGADGDAGERIAAMRERLDCKVRDLALDEFQDTAPVQWTVMEPLVSEIMAAGERRLLVVGDPKQSIYGWRGGTPALLESVRARPGLDQDVTLDTSWRSSPVVLAFVDAVFADLPAAIERAPLDEAPAGAGDAFRAAGLDAPAGVDRRPLARALAAWPYVRHRAAGPKAGMPGLVQAFMAAGPKVDEIAECVAEVVRARAAARPGAEIAVLVSRNAEVDACVAALRDAGLDVSHEGRSPVSDSAAAMTVLALLRIADRADDTIALWLATREPAASCLELKPMERHGGEQALRAAASAISRRVRQELVEAGLGPWVDRTAACLRGACSRHDLERLRQLSSLAHAADPSMAADPGRFVRAVESRLSGAAEQARIRVMTVHMSKGLEFDEVVFASMPERMGKVEAGPGEWAALLDHPAGAPVAIAPVISKEFVALSPLLAAFRAEAQVARLSDDVSKLYVALTRAKEAVHLVCAPAPAKDEPCVTATWIMRRALDGFEDAYAGATPVQRAPDAADGVRAPSTALPFWTFTPEGQALGELPPRPAPAEEVRAAPAVPAVERVARATGVRAPSTHAAADGGYFVREFEGVPDGERGSIAHAWFQRMEWCDGAVPAGIDEDELRAAVSVEIGRPVDAALADGVRRMVAGAVAGPMGAVLGVARCGGWGCDALEVRTEMPFAAVLDGTLVRGRMDRVVLGIRGGRVVRVEVVDWKTGASAVQGAAFEERIAPYRRQMDGYRRALCAMFGLAPADVTAVLAFPERGELLEIAGELRS